MALQIFERMRPHLAMLMGTTGFRGLISHTLMLTAAEARWMSGLHVTADGTMEGFDGTDARADEGNVILVAQLLGLLVAFIGEHLSLQTLREIWPELSFDGMDFE